MRTVAEYKKKQKEEETLKENSESPGKEKLYMMEITRTKEEAVERKLAQLDFKILGKSVSKFKVGNMREVWVPYAIYKYEYDASRKTMFNRNGKLDKRGLIHYVYDYNEAHPFQYDPVGDDEVVLKKFSKEKLNNAVVLKPNTSEKEVRAQLEWHTQNRVLRRIYGTEGTLKLVEVKKFYRAAIEIQVMYGKNEDKENFRYAYLDNYGIDSEHILGMKYRMN